MLWLTLRLLRTGNAQARKAALEKLRNVTQPGAVDAVAQAASSDKDPEVRKAAVDLLGDLRNDRSLDALIQGLLDPAPEVRSAAVDACRRRGDPKLKEPLQRVVLDSDNSVRWRAAVALRALGWDTRSNEQLGPAFLVALGRLREAAKFGPAAVDPLLHLLTGGAYHKRITAIEVLGELRDPRTVRPLLDALGDGDPLIRRAAAAALAKLSDPRSLDQLVRRLDDTDSNVRTAVVGALAEIGNPQTLDSLLPLAVDPHWEVRAAVAAALPRIPDERSVAALVQLLHDPDNEVRERAASGIADLGALSGLDALLLALVDEAPNVRQAAARSLRKLDPVWERSAAARRLVPRFQEALHHPDYSVQFAAIEVLRALGVPILNQEVPLARGPFGLDSPQPTSRPLVALLSDPEPMLRQAAVEALKRSGDWRVPTHLSTCLDDPDRWVRLAAAHALTTLQWQPNDPLDRARFELARENWNVLLEPGLPATPPLVKSLQSHSPFLRRTAIELLARVGDPDAVPPLIRETARPGNAIPALLALETLVSSQATRLETSALAALATLPDPPDAPGSPAVDCAALRQAAQEELERRNPSNSTHAPPH